MEAKVVDLSNKTVGTMQLSETVFGAPVREDLLARTVTWQLAKRRQGTHQTKTIGLIQGTTAKPYRQKGTGRARQGSLRSPQFRGGAVIFGPLPRDHGYKLPKKVRRLALRSALSSKLADGKLVVLDHLKLDKPRTKALAERLKKFGWQSVLFVGGAELDANFTRAAANLAGVDVLPQQGANVYDILRCEVLVLTRDAVEQLEARLK